MKKVLSVLSIVVGLSVSAFAHHPSPSDSAGGNMSSSSGHLTKLTSRNLWGSTTTN